MTDTPQNDLAEPETKSSAPRKTKTPRKKSAKKKTRATVVKQTVETTPVVAYSYATNAARASNTASAMPVLDLFAQNAVTDPPPPSPSRL